MRTSLKIGAECLTPRATFEAAKVKYFRHRNALVEFFCKS